MELGDWGKWLGLLMVLVFFSNVAGLQPSKTDPLQRFGLQKRKKRDPCEFKEAPKEDTCEILPYGKHPWIIRIKFDTDPKTKLPYLYIEHKDIFEKYTNLAKEGKQNHHTIMTGALITPLKVLTTRAWAAPFQMLLQQHKTFSRHFLWMYGYNYKDGCSQGRHAKEAIWHPKSNAGYFIGLLGDFALYTPWEPFEVEGKPFLLQKPHPIQDIADTINELIAKPAQLLMFLFKIDEDERGDVFNDEGSAFTFIGLPTCREMPNFKAQDQIRFDPDATNASFFCGNGIPGTWNASASKSAEGRVQDGATGAVAFYNDGGILFPLGLYDYWIGSSGEPRFFAAFTQVFFDWLDNAKFPSETTRREMRPPEGERDMEPVPKEYKYEDDEYEQQTTEAKPTPQQRAIASPSNVQHVVLAGCYVAAMSYLIFP